MYCGAAADTVDHITPLVRGGREHPSNLAPACRSCNSSKGDRLLTEWDTERVMAAANASRKVAAALIALIGGA